MTPTYFCSQASPCRDEFRVVFEPRTYRNMVRPAGLVSFRVVEGETDLLVHAERDLSGPAAEAVHRLRSELTAYVVGHPRFGESFVPVEVDASAPAIVGEMARAAASANVGPMAAVAGAFAEAVARAIEGESPRLIVENGGDVYLMGAEERVVALWAGEAVPAVGVRIPAAAIPCAVATSSGTIGPSVSLGRADAATVIAKSGALADAAASVVGNRLHGADDLESALAAGAAIPGVEGIVAIIDGHMGAWGAVELVPLDVSE